MTREGLNKVIAWMIALCSVDILTPIIDILGLPLPRTLVSMPLSMIFIFVASGMLIQMAWQEKISVFGRSEMVLAGLLAFWTCLEIIGAHGREIMRFDVILNGVQLLLVTAVSRLYLQLFKDSHSLISAVVLTASLLVLLHTTLLLAALLGIALPFVNGNELEGRNGMALLAPISLWVLALFPLKQWPVFGYRYNLLLILVLINILMSSARMDFLILAWCVLVGAILKRPFNRKFMRALLISASLVMVVMITFSYSMAQVLNDQGLWGAGDDATSVLSRAHTNSLLLNKLALDPILGIGWAEVAATRSFGYMGHTLYVNIFAAYGLIGMLAMIFALAFGLFDKRVAKSESAAHLLFLVILVTSFSNNISGYFGVIMALIAYFNERVAPKRINTLGLASQPTCFY